MKTPVSFSIAGNRSHFVRGLTSAAVLLALTACDSASIDTIQNNLANGEEVDLTLSTNDDGDLVVSLSDDDNNQPENGVDSEAGSFQVTFYNNTQGQLMTPPVVALHDPSVNLFQVGEEASDAVQAIAEMGNNAPLVEFALANPTVVSAAGVAGEAPFGPGESVTLNLTTSETGQVFSAVNMIICTNDGISGADSVHLPKDNRPVIIEARPYDAGTRVNQENSYSFFPPPCRTNAAGELIDVAEAPLESPRGIVGPHAGQFRVPNTPAGRNWDFATDDAVLKIEIVRN
jgi:hypothetical protein